MKKALFAELAASIREAGAIRRGEQEASRTFEFTAEAIKDIRDRLHKSQSEFAHMIGVTVSTLQNWEQGRRSPQGPARALLVLASHEPELVASTLTSVARNTRRATTARRLAGSADSRVKATPRRPRKSIVR